jgi:hypothetical protein
MVLCTLWIDLSCEIVRVTTSMTKQMALPREQCRINALDGVAARYCCAGVQLGSGSNSVIAAAVCPVSVPKSFWSNSPSCDTK